MTTTREVRPDQHGTRTGYTYGCRCEQCSQAARTYHSDYRKAHPESSQYVSDEACDRVMTALAIEADFDGLVIASCDLLGEHADLHHKTVALALTRLAESGRISMSRGDVRSNLARIQLSEADL